MRYPAKLKSGQTPTAGDFNELVAALQERTPLNGGLNTRLVPGPDGFRIHAQKGGSGGSSIPLVGFQLIDATVPGTGGGSATTQIRIVFGLIVANIPLASGVNPWPTGMSAGDTPTDVQAVSGSGAAWVEIEIDASTPTAPKVSAISIGTGSSVPSNDDTHAYLTIGTYAVATDGNSVAVTGRIGDQNYIYTSCPNWGTNPQTYGISHAFTPLTGGSYSALAPSIFLGLPTADPHVNGALWNNSGSVDISAG